MIKLYLTPGTRAGRVAWLLEELEIEYELEVLPFTKEGLKSSEHRSRHALGRVPVIEDGDVTIFESGAIVQTILLPPERRDETVLNQAMNLLSKSLNPVNEYLENKDYLIGNFSAADCMLGHSCYMANRMKCVNDEMLNIKRYVANIEERTSFQKAIQLGAE